MNNKDAIIHFEKFSNKNIKFLNHSYLKMAGSYIMGQSQR